MKDDYLEVVRMFMVPDLVTSLPRVPDLTGAEDQYWVRGLVTSMRGPMLTVVRTDLQVGPLSVIAANHRQLNSWWVFKGPLVRTADGGALRALVTEESTANVRRNIARIQLVDFSSDRYLVRGNTYPVKDHLRSMGGVWVPEKQAWRMPANLVGWAEEVVRLGVPDHIICHPECRRCSYKTAVSSGIPRQR